jgi:beta-mannosidase
VTDLQRRAVCDWTLEAVGPPAPDHLRVAFPVKVPGSAHAALVDRGEICDLTRAGRETDQQWASRTTWRYRTTVERPADENAHAELVFRGIDTVATVLVDGVERLRTANMFRTYRLDVTEDLRQAASIELTVVLVPALEVAELAESGNPLPRPAEYVAPYNQLRKMACSFGWDWGPSTGTAGLWQPVELHTWSGGRLAGLDVRATVPGRPRVCVVADVEGSAASVSVEVHDRTGRVLSTSQTRVVDGTGSCEVDVPSAELWWPRGEGSQPLYDVAVTLRGEDGQSLETQTRRVGFRTVEVMQTPDDTGRSFEVHVNGQRLWVRGVNWIPDDIFPERVSAQRYRTRLGQAADAGVNLVRVWGGGRYEDDKFYDACDELGLLVLQDFLFACAAYPEDDDTVTEVTAEATEAILRLRHRASLAIWCGCNESLWGFADWHWPEKLGGRPWGALYYYELLPALVRELDSRAYIPGSPFSPDGEHPNDPNTGTMHVWDVWNELDYLHYEQHAPRFAAEFGYQGPATWPTLVRAIGAESIDPVDPALAEHQKAANGQAKLQRGLDLHFPVPPRKGIAWYAATSLVQARAVGCSISHFRSLGERCSGAIYWQLNDCWPSISWSVVDVAGRRKLAWYALRDAFRQRITTVTMTPDGPCLVAVNDTDVLWTTEATVRGLSSAGAGTEETIPLRVAARANALLPLAKHRDGDLIVVDTSGADAARCTRWLLDDLTVRLPAHDPQVDVTVAHGGLRVTVQAQGLLRDTCLLAEIAAPDAIVEPQLVTLLPGESVTFDVHIPGAVPQGVDWADLVWSDNRLRDPS